MVAWADGWVPEKMGIFPGYSEVNLTGLGNRLGIRGR